MSAVLHAEHAIPDRELAHGRADGLELAGELGAEDSPLRSAEAEPGRQMNGFAARMWQSVRVTVVACTFTSTSSSRGTGAGTSFSRSTAGGP